jgi:hypothetical protein
MCTPNGVDAIRTVEVTGNKPASAECYLKAQARREQVDQGFVNGVGNLRDSRSTVPEA